MFDPEPLVRRNIRKLVPYSSARKEYSGSAEIFLDANENSFGSPIDQDFSRYPDPLQLAVKAKVAEIREISEDRIFIGNGSDEAIDLLFRIFCEPAQDNVVICPPTYGMYEVSAAINDVEVRRAGLTEEFDLDIEKIRQLADQKTKLLFICSPNNPTGNLLSEKAILDLAAGFRGLVVDDEAYIHFSGKPSIISEITRHANIVVLQTFSKAWGLAGLRVGLAFASPMIISLLNIVKPPYNVSQVAQEKILAALEKAGELAQTVDAIRTEREDLAVSLQGISSVVQVYPSDANFLLVKVRDAASVYRHLLEDRIVVRDRSTLEGCSGCLRITVGTSEENSAVIRSLRRYEESLIH
jgi:histidinol-phosphate aminotransferase